MRLYGKEKKMLGIFRRRRKGYMLRNVSKKPEPKIYPHIWLIPITCKRVKSLQDILGVAVSHVTLSISSAHTPHPLSQELEGHSGGVGTAVPASHFFS